MPKQVITDANETEWLCSRTPGRYERSFTLSNDIDSEGIKARMKNGVLTLELPKSAKAKARKIEVSAG